MGYLYMGNSIPNEIYIGTQAVKDVYLGTSWVWSQPEDPITMSRSTLGTISLESRQYSYDVQYVMVGAGGGGDAGDGGNRNAGNAGETGEVKYGTFRWTNGPLVMSVGTAGKGGTGNPRTGTAGTMSRLDANGTVGYITAAGGRAGGNVAWHGQAERRNTSSLSVHSTSFDLSGYGKGGRGGDGGIFGSYEQGAAGSNGYCWFRIFKVMP